jgi:hypothetical protein
MPSKQEEMVFVEALPLWPVSRAAESEDHCSSSVLADFPEWLISAEIFEVQLGRPMPGETR